jgi:hypothetical protein
LFPDRWAGKRAMRPMPTPRPHSETAVPNYQVIWVRPATLVLRLWGVDDAVLGAYAVARRTVIMAGLRLLGRRHVDATY